MHQRWRVIAQLHPVLIKLDRISLIALVHPWENSVMVINGGDFMARYFIFCFTAAVGGCALGLVNAFGIIVLAI